MYVRGVGPRVAEMLAAKDIQTAEDLLYHLPFRYEDRQNPRSTPRRLQPADPTAGQAITRRATLNEFSPDGALTAPVGVWYLRLGGPPPAASHAP